MNKDRKQKAEGRKRKAGSASSSLPTADCLLPSAPVPPSVRVFCAIELPVEVRERVAEHMARLRDAWPKVRASWERAEKLHITLKFLGEIEQTRVEALMRAAARAVEDVPCFELSIEGAGAFPPRGNPRVLWLGVTDRSGGLALLARRLEDECAREGFAREERPFHPHLTIARLRAPEGARRLVAFHQEMGFEAQGFEVTRLILIRSELGPGGSRYTELSQHNLRRL
jgi:2'-5' RNA ligase